MDVVAVLLQELHTLRAAASMKVTTREIVSAEVRAFDAYVAEAVFGENATVPSLDDIVTAYAAVLEKATSLGVRVPASCLARLPEDHVH
jgi:hypothetical protein